MQHIRDLFSSITPRQRTVLAIAFLIILTVLLLNLDSFSASLFRLLEWFRS
jgi:hypothetical protein